jgi:glucose-fructose oxidoreductase
VRPTKAVPTPSASAPPRVRFALVGLGRLAEHTLLPAFARVRNAALTALVSHDRKQLDRLGRKHGVADRYLPSEFINCLQGGGIDAVYIATPNDSHCEYAILAANAYKHVLCEKPLALTVEEGERMQAAARRRHVKFMTAYRLHLEAATRSTLQVAHSGEIGEVRMVSSSFGFILPPRSTSRLKAAHGGGALYDIGVYCINAARHVFAAEPTEVYATMPPPHNPLFREVDEATTAVLTFPGGRIATFTVNLNIGFTGRLEIYGTKGNVMLDPSYYFTIPLRQTVTVGRKSRVRTFPLRDQFADLIEHFADCVLHDRDPGSGAAEGIADLRVVEAIRKSAKLNRPVKLR